MPKTTYASRKRTVLGSRAYRNYSPQMLQLAVDMVRKKQITSYEAEKQFSIPRRTIEKKVHNQHSDKPGPKYRLSEEEENKFINVLVTVADYGFPLTAMDLRMVVYYYLKQNSKEHIFNYKPPGEFWVRSFLERHKNKLSLRSTQNIKAARAEKTVEQFKNYFDNLEKSLNGVPPNNILNYDETNVNDDPGSQKCIFKRGVKYPERIANYTKGCISVIFAATADGKSLPPYIIYKAEHLWTQWCQDGPEGARYNRTKCGWLDSITFLDWFRKIIVPWAEKLQGPKVIIGDNLSSHINIEVLELCNQNDIRFVLLPSNSTHLTQPLDVAFFGPVKKVWRKILLQYKIENPSQASLNKTHFPLLMKNLIDEIGFNSIENIKSGFRATGIYPYNPQKVFKRLPDYVEQINHDVDETLLNYLKEKRNPNAIRRGPNKKINVPPGTSISASDIEKPNLKKSYKGVTILSDVRGTLQNQTFCIPKGSSLHLRKINPDFNLFSATNTISNQTEKNKMNIKRGNKTKESRIKADKENINSKKTHPAKEISLNKESCSNEVDLSVASTSKSPEKRETEYVENDHILVRYIFKKKVDYYVGKILRKVNDIYEVSFYKKSGRSDSTIFNVPKKIDLDKINYEMIVKKVELLSINEEETRFMFLNDDDFLYFDY